MRLFVLLIAHMLADFTLQTNEMANRKKAETKFLLLHCAIYTVVMAVGCFLCMSIESACGMIAWFGATHLLIDWVRTKFENKNKDSIKAFGSFVVDQVLHIGIIFLMCWLLRNEKTSGWPLESLDEGKLDQILRYILLLVTIMDPASVLVKKLSLMASSKTIDGSVSDENHAGSLIGKLERLVISLLVMNNAYGSIGFVLTAKSLARHEKLSDPKFAETYLLGTLSSTVIAMVFAKLLG